MIVHGKETFCDELNLDRYFELELEQEIAPVQVNYRPTDVATKCNQKSRKLTLVREMKVITRNNLNGKLQKCDSRWNELKKMSERENGALFMSTDDFELFLWSPNAKFIKDMHLAVKEDDDFMIGIFHMVNK